MSSALVLVIPKSGHKAEFDVAKNTSKSLPGCYFKETTKVTCDLELTGVKMRKMLRTSTTPMIKRHWPSLVTSERLIWPLNGSNGI